MVAEKSHEKKEELLEYNYKIIRQGNKLSKNCILISALIKGIQIFAKKINFVNE